MAAVNCPRPGMGRLVGHAELGHWQQQQGRQAREGAGKMRGIDDMRHTIQQLKEEKKSECSLLAL